MLGAGAVHHIKSNSGKLESYVRGYVAALAYLYDAANKTECVAILQKHLPHMPAAVAEQCYTTMVAPGGFSPTAELDVAGVRKVLDLRSEYGRPQKQLTDPLRYYDPTYYRAARH